MLLLFAAAVRDFDESVEYLSSLSCGVLPFALMVVGSCCFVTCGSEWGSKGGVLYTLGGRGKGEGLYVQDVDESMMENCVVLQYWNIVLVVLLPYRYCVAVLLVCTVL